MVSLVGAMIATVGYAAESLALTEIRSGNGVSLLSTQIAMSDSHGRHGARGSARSRGVHTSRVFHDANVASSLYALGRSQPVGVSCRCWRALVFLLGCRVPYTRRANHAVLRPGRIPAIGQLPGPHSRGVGTRHPNKTLAPSSTGTTPDRLRRRVHTG